MRRDFMFLVLVVFLAVIFLSINARDEAIPVPSTEVESFAVAQEIVPVKKEPLDVKADLSVKQDEPATKDGTIVMYTSDSCVWCVKWKANELSKIKKAGWKFEESYVTDGPWPVFEVHGRGKTVRYVGYMTMSALKKIVDGM